MRNLSASDYKKEMLALELWKKRLRAARDVGYYPAGGDAHLVLDLDDIDATPLQKVTLCRGVKITDDRTTFSALPSREQHRWLEMLLKMLSSMRVWKDPKLCKIGDDLSRLLAEFEVLPVEAPVRGGAAEPAYMPPYDPEDPYDDGK